MKIKTIVTVLVYLATNVVSNSENEGGKLCESCMLVNGTCHNLTFLFQLQGDFRNQIVIPKMSLHVKKNILYYSFEPKIAVPEYYKVGFVNLDHYKDYGIMGSNPGDKQLFNFGTFAIDENNGAIYFGGGNGIFKLDTNTNAVIPFSSRGDTITSIFFKDNVYFTVHPENKIKVKKGDLFEEVKGFEKEYVKDFVIDKTGLIYYLGTKGLFARRNNVNTTLKLSDNPFFRGIAIDRNGDFYAWWIDGIYKFFKKNNWRKSSLVKIADLPLVGAMAFDKDDNMLLTLGRSLYKLIPTNEINCKSEEDL